jgi:hypothetical protein
MDLWKMNELFNNKRRQIWWAGKKGKPVDIGISFFSGDLRISWW